MRVVSSLIVLVFAATSLFAQLDKSYITIGAGYDMLSFRGDLNQGNKLTSLNNFRGGYNIFVEKRFLGLIGISANGMFGKLSQSENSSIRSLYFQSKVMQFDGRLSIYLDNKYLLGHETLFTPFISAGIGYLKFDPYGDLQSADGTTYYNWSDGSLKDLPENEQNESLANDLTRDYTYETQLTDSAINYSRGTFSIPLTLGINCKLSKNFYARVATTYNITGSDYIDNTAVGGKNDKFFSTNFSLTYTIGKKEDAAHQYKGIKFEDFWKEDHDGDGVLDAVDECQKTPKDVQVDGKGCPLDTDKDGVADYLDLEPNTPDSAHVNADGQTLTDEHFYNQHLKRDSVFTRRVYNLYEAPKRETLENIDNQIDKQVKRGVHLKMPTKFEFADYDHDGVIHSKEAMRALDDFLEGEIDISITTLYEMIDYYFEQ